MSKFILDNNGFAKAQNLPAISDYTAIKTIAVTNINGDALSATVAQLQQALGQNETIINLIVTGTSDLQGAVTIESTSSFGDIATFKKAIDLNSPTAAKGILEIVASDSTGNTKTKITNAAQAAARVYTIPDAGADANFVMDQGIQSIAGNKTFSGLSTFSGGVIFRTIASATAQNGEIFFDATNTNKLTVKDLTGTVKAINTTP